MFRRNWYHEFQHQKEVGSSSLRVPWDEKNVQRLPDLRCETILQLLLGVPCILYQAIRGGAVWQAQHILNERIFGDPPAMPSKPLSGNDRLKIQQIQPGAVESATCCGRHAVLGPMYLGRIIAERKAGTGLHGPSHESGGTSGCMG